MKYISAVFNILLIYAEFTAVQCILFGKQQVGFCYSSNIVCTLKNCWYQGMMDQECQFLPYHPGPAFSSLNDISASGCNSHYLSSLVFIKFAGSATFQFLYQIWQCCWILDYSSPYPYKYGPSNCEISMIQLLQILQSPGKFLVR